MKFNPYNVNFAKTVEEFYKTQIAERVTVVAIPHEAYKQAGAPRYQEGVNNRFAAPAPNDEMSYFRGLLQSIDIMTKDNEITVMEERELISYVNGLVK